MKLGEVLRIFRIANNKKVKDVAKELQCSNTFITEIEANRKKPSLETVKKLARCYEVTASQILLIHEESGENDWNFQKTLYEALIQWFKTNNPEWLETRIKNYKSVL